jgi:mono/diheme cytochrome c family protein
MQQQSSSLALSATRKRAFSFALLIVLAGSFPVQSEDRPAPMQSGIQIPPAGAPADSSPAMSDPNFNVEKLFANTCGWCHSDAGRKAGKGPQLMGTTLTDGEIMYRIKNGKTGQMPAFGSAFNEDQLKAIVAYIRALKP